MFGGVLTVHQIIKYRQKLEEHIQLTSSVKVYKHAKSLSRLTLNRPYNYFHDKHFLNTIANLVLYTKRRAEK